MKFLIIGGDAAGMSAASKAKRLDPDIEVTVLEMTSDVSYSACGMPYNIADPERNMNDLVVRSAKTFINENGIDLRTGHRADAIDPKSKTVTGKSDEDNPFALAYDKLLIATGASPLMPDIPGINLPGVMALKSLEHGRLIKTFIDTKPVRKAVIIGMGYIGMELCEAFRERGIEVDMVKPGPELLPWMPHPLTQKVIEVLKANEVGCYPGHAIKEIKHTNGQLQVLCDGLELTTDLVVVATGVRPNSEIASFAGLETGISNAICVDHELKTSEPDIYAAGDCADAFHVVTGKRCWIPLALRANRAGWAVAENVCGGKTRLKGVAGTAVFKLLSLEIARTGLSLKEAEKEGFDPVQAVIKTRSRAHRHKGSKTIHAALVGDKQTGLLLGAQMVGEEGVAHRINAAAVALHSAMTVTDFYQSDLAYAPPFGPVWDPLLTAAGQLIKLL